ncbi:hypothetical protein LTR22_026794 [Elasticomyces elasticus]|nr:hypothetical protein LTR22_026794 [Elasticomyces elasticus]
MEKPSTATQLTTADVENVAPCVQDMTLPLPATPLTPATPVSAEAFASLQDLIIRQHAHALEEANREQLKRHLHKLTEAAQTSIPRNALQQERIKFLLRVNDEAKPRRSTKSLVLGKAKVISYEDLMAARAKRAEKEAGIRANNKRKRKETSTRAARIDGAQERASVPVHVVAPCPGRAPIARMW